MTGAPQDIAAITSYHAHIYYDPAATREAASRIRDLIAARFPAAQLGRWHDVPVGPHPIAMYQVAFSVEDFPRLVPWLMLNRGELVILVHPNTDDEYEDHAHHAVWLGAKLPLRLEILKKRDPA
jgi:aromatic ring-cleaving dioxygenase